MSTGDIPNIPINAYLHINIGLNYHHEVHSKCLILDPCVVCLKIFAMSHFEMCGHETFQTVVLQNL